VKIAFLTRSLRGGGAGTLDAISTRRIGGPLVFARPI
jgi:hypothetical protein